MKTNFIDILVRVMLFGFELLFVGVLGYLRVLNIGWLLIIFGIGLVLWVFIHLGLMTAFIVGLRLSVLDILLYMAVHFFYLFAWLFQSDGGDDGSIYWTFRKIYDSPGLTAFAQKMGDNLFYIMSAGVLLCYIAIAILLVVRMVRYMRLRQKAAQLAATP